MAGPREDRRGPELLDVQRIWDRSEHAGMTDLVRFRGRFFCTFRDGEKHVYGRDGKAVVLTCPDGEDWSLAATLEVEGVDLRDPKFSETPDGRLMMLVGGDIYEEKTQRGRCTRVAFSEDGRRWSDLQKVTLSGPGTEEHGAEWEWLWRAAWHDGWAWAASYSQPGGGPELRLLLVKSRDGVDWEVVTELEVPDWPNEATVRPIPGGELLALVRREKGDCGGWIGTAAAPYTDWRWVQTEHRLGGPDFVALPGGAMWAGSRGSDGDEPLTVLARLTRHSYTPVLTLPSGGDTSYPGFVWHDGVLWVSYYSSHEGRSCVYLARVKP